MDGQKAMFGVNFADGRIKGYPVDPTPIEPNGKGFYVLIVRGNKEYGINDFKDNEDGTITDKSTGLMWQQNDSKSGMNWEDALNWVQQKNSENYLGYNDWRLPNVKELQSIVGYTRSSPTTSSAAIDPLFNCSTITGEGAETNYPFYWSGTTHENMMNGANAAYVCFGESLGWMEIPPMSGNYTLMDVHGAGAQRSDPKEGNPDDYPYGHGPQGDVIRIYNFVRLVRDANSTTSVGENSNSSIPKSFVLNQNYPNPFNPSTTISWQSPVSGWQTLKIYDSLGNNVTTLVDEHKPAGSYSFSFDAGNLASGVYICNLQIGSFMESKKPTLLK